MTSTTHYVITNSGVHMPRLIYGTAWKKERTTDLVVRAVLAGFRGIDTACQPKHYQEDLVGNALEILQKQHGIDRKDLFIQTKFTSLDGQDPTRIPYDSKAPLSEQVRQSLAKSLSNLKTDYIDSLVMHSPMRTHSDTMLVWKIFEEFHTQGKVKQLGISNIYNPHALAKIHEEAKVKPAVIQNRFYAETGYDKEIRDFCNKHNIVYQSFWTLTANPHILRSPIVRQIAEQRNATSEQVFFRFVMDIGIAPLTGTTNETHMKQDLEVMGMAPLEGDEIQKLLKMLE